MESTSVDKTGGKEQDIFLSRNLARLLNSLLFVYEDVHEFSCVLEYI